MSLVFAARLGGPRRKIIALKLADHANDDGAGIYPSIDRIAREAETSRSSVERTLRAFIRDGLLVVVVPGGGRRKPTHYRMHLPWLHERLFDEKKPRQSDVVSNRNHVKLTNKPRHSCDVLTIKEPSKKERAPRLEVKEGAPNGAPERVGSATGLQGRASGELLPNKEGIAALMAAHLAKMRGAGKMTGRRQPERKAETSEREK